MPAKQNKIRGGSTALEERVAYGINVCTIFMIVVMAVAGVYGLKHPHPILSDKLLILSLLFCVEVAAVTATVLASLLRAKFFFFVFMIIALCMSVGLGLSVHSLMQQISNCG